MATPALAFCSWTKTGQRRRSAATHVGSATYPPVPTTQSGRNRASSARPLQGPDAAGQALRAGRGRGAREERPHLTTAARTRKGTRRLAGWGSGRRSRTAGTACSRYPAAGTASASSRSAVPANNTWPGKERESGAPLRVSRPRRPVGVVFFFFRRSSGPASRPPGDPPPPGGPAAARRRRSRWPGTRARPCPPPRTAPGAPRPPPSGLPPPGLAGPPPVSGGPGPAPPPGASAGPAAPSREEKWREGDAREVEVEVEVEGAKVAAADAAAAAAAAVLIIFIHQEFEAFTATDSTDRRTASVCPRVRTRAQRRHQLRDVAPAALACESSRPSRSPAPPPRPSACSSPGARAGRDDLGFFRGGAPAPAPSGQHSHARLRIRPPVRPGTAPARRARSARHAQVQVRGAQGAGPRSSWGRAGGGARGRGGPKKIQCQSLALHQLS